MKGIKVADMVKVGSWEEVEGLTLKTITKNEGDNSKLDGLVLKGYEMKWGAVNENGEKYEKNAFDDFIESYFVARGLNMPLTIEHLEGIENLCGRVLLIETNSVGFYFIAYIPRTYMYYSQIKNLLKEGILQGFSKEGFATDYEFDKDGVMNIKKMDITRVSLVSTPANGLKLEKSAEIVENALKFNKEKEIELTDILFN